MRYKSHERERGGGGGGGVKISASLASGLLRK